MTYKGTIDEDKQIVVSRELNPLDKQLIRIAYTSPTLRKTALKLVVSNSTNDLKSFAEGRKWKNPETSNLVGIDHLLDLASKDKMWAKAVVKKVTEEYQKAKEQSVLKDTSTQKSLTDKIKVDVEKEIAKFKTNKDITNPKDRAEFEAFLDEKLRPAQEELYRKKIKEATGLAKEEFKKASEGLLGKGVQKALSRAFDDMGLNRLADLVAPKDTPSELGTAKVAVGAGLLSQVAAGVAGGGVLKSIAFGVGKVVLSPFIVGAGLALSYKVYKNYKETPEGAKRDELKKKFNAKKEELTKKIMREYKYEEKGKQEALTSGMKEFFKGEKFDDEVLGEDVTVEELYKITESNDYDLEEQRRAKKLIEDKKKEYMASKFTRQKALISETKGKKFKAPNGKRVDVKGLLEMEESGNEWASLKLKDLRETIEGAEEISVNKEDEESNKEHKLLLSDRDLSKYQDMTNKDLERELLSLDSEQIKKREKQLERIVKKPNKQKDNFSVGRNKKTEDTESPISSGDAEEILSAFSKIKKEKESLESKFKDETFKDPDGKDISFNTLRKIVSDSDHKNHDWGTKTYEGLKKKIKKMGAEKETDQDKEINKIVKDKFESALTVDPDVINLFKEFSKDGKFQEERFNEVLKGISELGKLLTEDKKSNKKASDIKESLIKIAYLHPDLRKDILEFLK